MSGANPPRSIAFLISLSFFATTCFAFAKKLGMLEMTWLQVFTPVMGYFAILILLNIAVAAMGWANLWPYMVLAWRTWRLKRLMKRMDALTAKVNADLERLGRIGR